ncbi:hypothetical protein BDQ17DRAFT_1321331 [Cyathus striatus]|nr:hypothetical protein BDQ17DRAFT_1321331 [Cyathus striatus]
MGHTPVHYLSRCGRDCHASPVLSPDHTSSAVHDLPPELLIEVFTYCAREDDLAPVTLRRVSKWWRDIIDSSPRIWNTIFLDDVDRPISSSRQQCYLWVEKSLPLQYDVELNTENPDNILPLLSPLLPTINRWGKFVLTGKRAEKVNMPDLAISPASLDHLNINLVDADLDDFDDDETPSKITFAPTYDGWLYSYTMNIWLAKLPSPDLLAPLSFTHLCITEVTFNNIRTSPLALLQFLTVCSSLETLLFSSWPHDDEPPPTPLPVVSLPELRTLHVKSTCSARAILSSLHTPRLRNLYLTHLNVDFRLQGEYHEDGDSDDEAHDFSQSPWSDHATGMGLRKLISRSNPPIKILEMDFSDMRTKDFKYVFDRLTELQEFRIVASDMSDNVINFLRPQTDMASLGSSEKTSLRLPHLRELRLVNCNRLTGDAIVDALLSRLAYTDAETPLDTLEDIRIVGCERFGALHQHKLTIELGERFRLHA